MVNVNFAKNEYLDIIECFEKNNFGKEAYSKDMLQDILKDIYLLKNNDSILVAQDDNEVIGYIIFHISDDFTDIYKIFIRENNRRQKLATRLIDEVYKLAKRYNSKKLILEVRANNLNAINFYKFNNFNQINIRKNYYSEPTDDAIIFERMIEV